MLANGLKVFFKKLDDKAFIPTYAKDNDACCDLYSVEEVDIEPMEVKLVDTGIAIEMPDGFEAQIRPRSGNAWKHKITVLNSPGTIDAGYRNSIKVMLINFGKEKYTVNVGDRIAQMKFSPVIQGFFIEKQELSSSDRALGGFGSTGR